MNKSELETIVLDCLARLEAETKTASQGQDAKITRIENRVNDFERHLTRLSESYRRLEPLIEGLNAIVAVGEQ